MNKYALVGKSLKHSYSKIIHEEFYKEFEIPASYDLVELKDTEIEGFVEKLREGLYQGINITIPYKKEFISYLDYIDPKAKAIGSINTILVKNKKLYGYNTDFAGFIYSLKKYKINPLNKDCYILGTGGVSLTVKEALLELGAKSVSFVSRGKVGKDIISYEELEKREIPILVNATPVGMYPNTDNPINETVAKKVGKAIDLIYNPLRTPFLESVGSYNNGLPMLIYQAIKAIEIWNEKSYNYESFLERMGDKLESIWK